MWIFSRCPPSESITLAISSCVMGRGVAWPLSRRSIANASLIPITIGNVRSPSFSRRKMYWSPENSVISTFDSSIGTCMFCSTFAAA